MTTFSYNIFHQDFNSTNSVIFIGNGNPDFSKKVASYFESDTIVI